MKKHTQLFTSLILIIFISACTAVRKKTVQPVLPIVPIVYTIELVSDPKGYVIEVPIAPIEFPIDPKQVGPNNIFVKQNEYIVSSQQTSKRSKINRKYLEALYKAIPPTKMGESGTYHLRGQGKRNREYRFE